MQTSASSLTSLSNNVVSSGQKSNAFNVDTNLEFQNAMRAAFLPNFNAASNVQSNNAPRKDAESDSQGADDAERANASNGATAQQDADTRNRNARLANKKPAAHDTAYAKQIGVPAQDAANESTSLSDVDEMLRLIGDAEKAAAAEVAADEPLDDKTAFDNQRSAAPQTATLPATDNPNAADAAVAARADAHAAQSNDDVEAAEFTKSMPEAPRQIRSFRHSSDGESAALRVDSSRAQAHALSIDRNTMHAKSDRMDRSASTVDAANPIAGMSIGTAALASNADQKSNRDSSGFGGFSTALQSSTTSNTTAPSMNTTQQPSFAETLRPMEATPFIATPVGHAGWAGEVSKAVIRLVDRDLAEAKLSLNPEHLGPLDVSLDLSGSSIAVSFVAASPEAKQALEQSLPQLARMMSEAGISLGQTSVNQQDRHAHEQRADGQSDPSNKSISRVSQSRDQRNESAPAASLNGFRPLTVRPGGVDLYA